MEDFLRFRQMLTPVLIEVIFWAGVVVSILTGLGFLLKGGLGAVLGLIYIFIGPLVIRVWCELIIVIFRINETLTDIRNSLGEKGSMGN